MSETQMTVSHNIKILVCLAYFEIPVDIFTKLLAYNFVVTNLPGLLNI